MTKFALLAGAMLIAGPAIAQDSGKAQPGRAPITEPAAATAPAQPAPVPATPPAAPADQVQPAPATTAQAAPAPATAPVAEPAQAATAQPAPATPVEAAPAQQAVAEPAPVPAQPAPQAAAATPSAASDQVAAVVAREFPTYDGDKDGNLTQAEFGTWMVALKKASDPAITAESAETRTWLGAAFAQADKDKSKTISQAELMGFLAPAKS